MIVDPAIVWPGDTETALARVIAHELAHALGLTHIDDLNAEGDLVDDAFDDTVDFDDTLMERRSQGARSG